MILYRKGGIYHVLNLCSFDGSVFPQLFAPSLVCATIAGLMHHFNFHSNRLVMNETAGWQGFSYLVGFMIVFRTSMAYSKFWEGCTQLYRMRSEWMDACSSLIAFTKYGSRSQEEEVDRFRHLLIRLFSMLHALALAEVEDSSSSVLEDITAFRYELIDPDSIDPDSLDAIKASDAKVDLVFQWIQQLIAQSIPDPSTGQLGIILVPAPILSRSFQELANGMIHFQEAVKVSSIPFPFPYAQTCDCLLVIHWLVTPLVTCQWFSTPLYSATFTFIIVFIFWVLNSVAVEIENPFGPDPNDINCEALHQEMNTSLMQLLSEEGRRTPVLVTETELELEAGGRTRRGSFIDVWDGEASRRSNRASWDLSAASNTPSLRITTRMSTATSNRGDRSISFGTARSERSSSSSNTLSHFRLFTRGRADSAATSEQSQRKSPPDKLPASLPSRPSDMFGNDSTIQEDLDEITRSESCPESPGSRTNPVEHDPDDVMRHTFTAGAADVKETKSNKWRSETSIKSGGQPRPAPRALSRGDLSALPRRSCLKGGGSQGVEVSMAGAPSGREADTDWSESQWHVALTVDAEVPRPHS